MMLRVYTWENTALSSTSSSLYNVEILAKFTTLNLDLLTCKLLIINLPHQGYLPFVVNIIKV